MIKIVDITEDVIKKYDAQMEQHKLVMFFDGLKEQTLHHLYKDDSKSEEADDSKSEEADDE